jgi:POT family proton-dependent oligopeptide transporter
MALGLICVGNGLFKANPSSLLSKCYTENDPRLHGAFTLYYMAINLGSLVALFVGPTLSSKYGYSYAFFVSFIGILLGISNYFFQQRHIANMNTFADKRRIHVWQWSLVILGILSATMCANFLLQHVFIAKRLVWLVTLVVVSIYFYFMKREDRRSSKRMLVAFILMLEAVIFFTLYQQMPTSLNLFAVNNVHAELFGIPIDPQSFQALNPTWIITLSPVLALLYARLNQKGIVFLVPQKFAVGMACCGVSFLFLFFPRFFHDDAGMVSSWWLVGSYLFQALGELMVSALGVAMVAELVPRQIVGFVMGIWFLTSSVAGFLGALVASYTSLPTDTPPSIESLILYTHVFACIGLITLGVAAVLWLISPYLNQLMNPPE